MKEKWERVSIKLNGNQIETRVNKKPSAGESKQAERVGQRAITGPEMPSGIPSVQVEQESAFDRLQKLREEPHAALEPVIAGKREERVDHPEEEEWNGAQGALVVHPAWVEDLPPRPSRNHLAKLLLSACGAVVVGLCFGFMVLTVFTQEEFTDTYRTVLDGTVQTMTANPPLPPKETDKETGTEQAAAGIHSAVQGEAAVMELREWRMYMAQVGAFTDRSAAEKAIANLKGKGYPHFLYPAEGKHYLFTAAASSRDDILGLASSLKATGMDVFVKEVAIPGATANLPSAPESTAESGSGAAAFFSDGIELARRLSDWSGRYLNGGGAAPMTAADEATVKELHRRFLDESRVLQAHAPETWKGAITGMVNGINQAVEALSQTQAAIREKKPKNAEAHAWQIQSGTLAWLEQYVQWQAQAQSS